MTTSREQHRAWEAIAASFDRSRTRRWPHVESFVRGVAPGARVLDLMGGNGRHTGAILEAGHDAVWSDWSRPAARIVAARYPSAAVLVGDATALPLADASFDAAILVAGLHSVPTPQGRAEVLGELHRVLKPGGAVQVTVWSRDATRFRDQGPPGETFDILLPWRSHGHDEARHYHLYTPAVLRAELQAAGFAVVLEATAAIVGPEPDNLIVVAMRAA